MFRMFFKMRNFPEVKGDKVAPCSPHRYQELSKYENIDVLKSKDKTKVETQDTAKG